MAARQLEQNDGTIKKRDEFSPIYVAEMLKYFNDQGPDPAILSA